MGEDVTADLDAKISDLQAQINALTVRIDAIPAAAPLPQTVIDAITVILEYVQGAV